MSAGNTTLTSLQSRNTDVQGTAANTVLDDVEMNDCSNQGNATVPPSKSNGDTEDVDKQGDGLEKVRAEADNEVTEVKFVIPERQQTAEDFDLRKFLVDVEQLAASLQAVVRRQEVEDFQGDRLAETVSAVVGTMHNYKAFSNRVYDLLEIVRDQMKSVNDFMNQTVLHQTKWDNLTFKGIVSLCFISL